MLEAVGIIHEEHHHHNHHGHGESGAATHEHNTANHDAADELCRTTASFVKAPDASDSVAFTHVILALFWEFEPLTDVSSSGLSPPSKASRELSTNWQFSYRAALPVRAPSVIS